MAVAATVFDYLQHENILYDVVMHSPTESAAESARESVLPLVDVIKSVILRDGQNRLMAIIPADKCVDIRQINHVMGAHYHLDAESDIDRLFDDCVDGAVPGLGQAYNIPVIWDDALGYEEDVYFEAGDHRELIHLRHDQFLKIMQRWPHGAICRPRTTVQD
ncbi:aminoacyl-tRNA deacylase [Alkalimarinus sediminis]|uniref:YbaK/EbsC family protein n=1 Tax=Alkalimarinus sediminis TaxID=1632866 RepID=A0A9E8HT28_9ALTE|nr:YbaK/EbsC family protein [Alkalimarinus sediminis]UZW75254.1 YbaK/EbsC family protein [Alkalimarinus sediminis]